MRKLLAIGVALFMTGCSVLRHDSMVYGIFPDEAEYADGIFVEWEWAR